jgi:adenosylcobinamide kinase/adenosylcobinamide-phosphate guanylyltransferase
MGRLIAYLGGIRSGKSRLAEARFTLELKKRKAKGTYLATLDSRLAAPDPEMRARLEAHRARRPAAWTTLEVGRGLLKNANHPAMLLDGLGMWAALRLEDNADSVVAEADAFCALAKKALCVAVLDEVGQGGVSASASARKFADLNGRLNQAVAAAAHEVWRVDAGLAFRIK